MCVCVSVFASEQVLSDDSTILSLEMRPCPSEPLLLAHKSHCNSNRVPLLLVHCVCVCVWGSETA